MLKDVKIKNAGGIRKSPALQEHLFLGGASYS